MLAPLSMRTQIFAVSTLAIFLLFPKGAGAVDATARVTAQYGKAYPFAEIGDFLDSGTAYRLDLFGGAKLQNIKFLSAIGLGVDITYTSWKPKRAEAGFRYQQYQWDWFKLPVSVWNFVIEPGIIWMITDVQIPSRGIDQTSIRPGINLNLGFRLPLFNHVNFRADGRIQRVMLDKERTSTNEEITVTGQQYGWFAGLEAYF
jgi:hypothetical protein